MPLTAKGEKIMSAMKSEYGGKKGEEVFYATKNKGEIAGVDSDNSFKKGDRVKDQHGETFEVISSNGNMVKVWSKNASGGKDYHYTKLSRNDAFPPGYQDVVYNGHKIIIGGAGDYYAVFKNGVVLKSKFISVDEAKKWIDRKDETGPSMSDPSMTIAERIDTMAQQIGGLSAKVKDIVRSDALNPYSLNYQGRKYEFTGKTGKRISNGKTAAEYESVDRTGRWEGHRVWRETESGTVYPD